MDPTPMVGPGRRTRPPGQAGRRLAAAVLAVLVGVGTAGVARADSCGGYDRGYDRGYTRHDRYRDRYDDRYEDDHRRHQSYVYRVYSYDDSCERWRQCGAYDRECDAEQAVHHLRCERRVRAHYRAERYD